MAIYDISQAIRPVDIAGSYQQGATFGNALRELAAKRAEEARQQEIRNGLMQFYRQAQPERTAYDPVGPNPLDLAMGNAPQANVAPMTDSPMMRPRVSNEAFRAMTAGQSPIPSLQARTIPAQPGGFDYQGAADYLASKGELEQSGALAKLRQYMQPEGAEYGLNPQLGINPDTGKPEFFVTNKSGAPKFLGVTERPKLEVKGGWIVDPQTGEPSRPVPMTPKEAAAERRAEAQLGISSANLNLSASEATARREREAREASEKAQKLAAERQGKFKAVDELDSTLAAYEAALKQASRADLANPISDRSTQLKSLATQLQMAYKNAAELGAITGPDWAIINRIVETPVGAKAALLGPGKLLGQLGEVRNLSKRQRDLLNKQYGAPAKSGWSITKE